MGWGGGRVGRGSCEGSGEGGVVRRDGMGWGDWHVI